jgi:hypothetical protein
MISITNEPESYEVTKNVTTNIVAIPDTSVLKGNLLNCC